MSEVFQRVIVTPHWGTNTVVVQWTVPHDFYQGNFIVFRSRGGITSFEEIAHGPGIDHFIDTVVPKDRISEFFYRIVLQYKGKRYDSDVVSTYGEVPRIEFGMSHQIMKLEYLRMRRCHSIKIFRQKLSGEICSDCSDQDTEQRIGTTLCDQCFGTGIVGGFEPAVDSNMLIVTKSPVVLQDAGDGTGTNDPNQETARILPYPPLRKNDLIVQAKNDQRWLVQSLMPYYCNDNVPVVYDATLQVLRRNDIRYKVQ